MTTSCARSRTPSFVMAGAIVTQLVFVDDGDPVIPIILGLLALVIAWLRRDRSVDTLRRLRRLSRPGPARA